MSGRTARVAELKSRLKRHERKKQRMNTTKAVMALTKDDVRAGDKTYPSHGNSNYWWGPKSDRDRMKKPHRPNDESKKFYYRKYFHLCDFTFSNYDSDDDIREYGKPKFYDAYLLYKV
jgi:hypothetical protein